MFIQFLAILLYFFPSKAKDQIFWLQSFASYFDYGSFLVLQEKD